MRVPSLGWEDPLEKGMATHSSIVAWRIPWTEKPGWLQYGGHTGSDTTALKVKESLVNGTLPSTKGLGLFFASCF